MALDETRDRGHVQSVDRCIDILEALAAAPEPLGPTDLKNELGLAYGTVHRLLGTLRARGLVITQGGASKYTLGPKLVRLGERAGAVCAAQARPFLARIAAETGETANMATLDGDQVMYVAQVPSNKTVRMFTEVGQRVLPHATAVGKVLLAALPPERVAGITRRTGLPAYTDRTITDRDQLFAHLEQVRRQGWAVDEEEREQGVCCLAVPARTGAATLSAFSISGPSGRLGMEDRPALVEVLTSVAEAFEQELHERAPTQSS